MRTLVSAHRGACGVPGLPIAESFRRAIELGVDFVEFDVRTTRDAVPIVWHDPELPSHLALKAADYGDCRAELGDQCLALEDLLDLASGRVKLHCDLKEVGNEIEIVGRLLARVPLKDVFVTSLREGALKAVKTRWPQIQTGLTLGRDLAGEGHLKKARVRVGETFPGGRFARSRADFISVHHQLARLNVLRYCGSRAIPAWVWTVDEQTEIRRFVEDERVTTIISDRPDLVLALTRPS
jgi:glycerophosphoryl diester phosphodiesterase